MGVAWPECLDLPPTRAAGTYWSDVDAMPQTLLIPMLRLLR